MNDLITVYTNEYNNEKANDCTLKLMSENTR